jgi:hypothetical protein
MEPRGIKKKAHLSSSKKSTKVIPPNLLKIYGIGKF